MKRNIANIQFLSAMGIFGTVGLVVRAIPLPSATVAFIRGAVGCLFLLAFLCLTGKGISKEAIRKNLWVLCLSGVAIGFNWILLFEAYRYTTVATATVCYYLAPAFLLLASALIGEKLTGKHFLCIALSLVGALCLSGVLTGKMPQLSDATGIGCGIGAAVLYATVMLLNKKLKDIGAYDKTVLQLGVAALVVLPYMLLTGTGDWQAMTPVSWLWLAVAGIVHTGIAYTMYFGAMGDLSAKTVAVFSYLDPVVALLLSALLLHEKMDIYGIVGTVLILGSALYSELPTRGRNGYGSEAAE